eukprot:g5394.t1
MSTEDEPGPSAAGQGPLGVLDDLLAEHPMSVCKSASQKHRLAEGLALTSPSLVYGEIPLSAFLELLTHVKEKFGFVDHGARLATGGRFVDLGCGAGKAVFAAALCPNHDFAVCTGVEILEPLYGMCLELLASWKDEFAPALSRSKRDTEICFLHGDMLLTDWGEAECVFCNCATFDADTMEKLSDYAQDLSKGVIFLAAGQKLVAQDDDDGDPAYELLEEYFIEAPFGSLTVFIYRKLSSY